MTSKPRPQTQARSLDRVRRPRSKRQADAGGALARGVSRGRPPSRIPDVPRIHDRRSAPRSAARCRASATISPTRCSCSTSPIDSSSGRASRRGSTPGTMVVCDRYLASSIAYGEAQGVDAAWLTEIQRFLPQPSLTILLDIPPDASLTRKKVGARQVRARHAAARPRARKLPAPGRAVDGLDPPRRRAGQGRRVGGVVSAVRSRLGLL